jgi:hypothetical protein
MPRKMAVQESVWLANKVLNLQLSREQNINGFHQVLTELWGVKAWVLHVEDAEWKLGETDF